ncbi:MAG: AmmeMemoRadiSam system radical SAM enzyme [Chloroflexia bacterium]|nr:AmmeMemoRadiSam system radical SAM enzyme [Chloroflexia bacterium]
MKEAMFYEKLDEQRVRCNLCAHHCLIREGQRGICGVRENQGGVLQSLVYGRPISMAVDPVEKKPLFHFYPGTSAFSIATVGCNFCCRFCQNADISQWPREHGSIMGKFASPEEVVRQARRHRCRSIAYTYTEPTIFSEYAYDIAVLAHEAGIANVYVTNGYMTDEMLETFSPYLDAANVDLKAFSEDFYKKQCGGRLQPVLDSLKTMVRLGIWVEVTTLIIPGENDDPAELGQIAAFIAGELGPEVPWHISRFYPQYRMLDRPPTEISLLHEAREIGEQAGLHYIYEGNVPGQGGEDTVCPGCGQTVIRRYGYRILDYGIEEGHCRHCGAEIAGRGM